MRTRQKKDPPHNGPASTDADKVVELRQRTAKTGGSKQAATSSRLIRRINLDLPEKPAEHLDWLQEQTGAISTAEVIRNALKLYYGLACEVKEGGSIILKSGDGTEKELRIFL